jgi:hypothetical protein
MKYSMVKQFSNSAIDNAYTFVFKIVDFAKIFYEMLWAFLEIWIAFFLIFYNAIMYVYYLFVFALDRGVESNTSMFFMRKIPKRISRTPAVLISNAPNPIPSQYLVKAPKVSAPSVPSFSGSSLSTPATLTSLRGARPGAGAKRNIVKSVLEFFANIFYAIKRVVTSPAKTFLDFFETKMKPVRHEEPEKKSDSLIDQYMKEYEKKKAR